MSELFTNVQKCILNTGNILALNDITRKSGQNPTEELIEAINITMKDYEKSVEIPEGNPLIIRRNNDDLAIKMGEQDLSDLKIGLKLFLKNNDKSLITESIKEVFNILKVNQIQNVVITYNQKSAAIEEIDQLKSLWIVLEELVKDEKVQQIGLADVEETIFRLIYGWATIKPKIIQINLATCCVVPQSLRDFCKDNDVQLLTHSDTSDILPQVAVEQFFGKSISLQWILRFLIHIKCRGVLITKGYLISLKKN